MHGVKGRVLKRAIADVPFPPHLALVLLVATRFVHVCYIINADVWLDWWLAKPQGHASFALLHVPTCWKFCLCTCYPSSAAVMLEVLASMYGPPQQLVWCCRWQSLIVWMTQMIH
jgi:hypothetical protein